MMDMQTCEAGVTLIHLNMDPEMKYGRDFLKI
jgi:hypothetical protein